MVCTDVIYFLCIIKWCFFKLCVVLTSLVPLFSSQALCDSTRICPAKHDMCTASMDLVMEIGACVLSEHDKPHLLYSAATAQSTMDYLRKAVKDDAVDSPPSHGIVPLPISSPSPLRGRGAGQSSKSRHRDTNGVQRSLNLDLSQSPNNVLHKVGLLYLLFCTALSTGSLFCISKSEATLHELMFLLHVPAYAHPTEVNMVCTLA